jgi:hypothetical protein
LLVPGRYINRHKVKKPCRQYIEPLLWSVAACLPNEVWPPFEIIISVDEFTNDEWHQNGNLVFTFMQPILTQELLAFKSNLIPSQ